MTSYTWKGVSGDWNVASDWTPSGGPPRSTDSATIGGTGTYTVAVDSSDVAKSLTLSDANATVNDTSSLTIGGAFSFSAGVFNIGPSSTPGSLDVGGTFTLNGGALNVDNGTLTLGGTLNESSGSITLGSHGTISGGTLDATGGAFNWDGGTLSGVTYEGTLNLTGNSATGFVTNGLTMAASSGGGSGTINVTGPNASLDFSNTETISNATINLGNSAGANDYLEEYDSANVGNAVLTLASSDTVHVQGNAQIAGRLSGDGIVSEGVIEQTGNSDALYIEPGAFTNSGTIDAEATNAALYIRPATFTNNGTIDVANGDTVNITPTVFTTTASSVIAIGANSSATIDPTNGWSNLGSITLANGASLTLGGSISSLGSISSSGGTVYLEGTLSNSGHTLKGSSIGLVLDRGTITGGTVAGLAASNGGGTLSGVTFDGTLNLTANSASVQLANGFKMAGSNGAGRGTINVTGPSATLDFDNTETVSNATINVGNSGGGSDYLYEYDTGSVGNQVLTLASNDTVDVQGNAQIYGSGFSGDGIINKGLIEQTGNSGTLDIHPNAFTNAGTIDAEAPNATLDIEPGTLSNSGTIDVANGDFAYIGPTTFANLSAGKLTGGTYEAEAGSTLRLQNNGSITTDDAHIILSGAGSTIEDFDSNTGLYDTIDTTLRTIGVRGVLELLADRSWTTEGAAIANNGQIELGGGELTAVASGASFTNASGAKLYGFGTVDAPNFTNSGMIEASSAAETLDFKTAISGTGEDQISGASTLGFDAKVSAGQTVSFTGSGGELALHDTGGFTGLISGFDTAGAGSNDTIEVAGPWLFTGFKENAGGTEGTLGFVNGGSTLSLTLLGDYKGHFVGNPGPNGSTLITYT
jgi:hypothetical protein